MSTLLAIEAHILLVEDDDSLAGLLQEELTDASFQVERVASAEAAVDRLQQPDAHFDVIVSDLRLPGASGLQLLTHVRERPSSPAFLVITAFGSIAQAVEALKLGADDFLTKPLDLEHFRLAVQRILQNRQLREEVRRARELMAGDHFHDIYGRSACMQELFQQIRQVSLGAGPVLIGGESGVGKELVARAIHDESDRAAGPFQAINCAGIPTELLESEFFGHAAGAFTGAKQARKGLFAEAHGGTLLLDEIGEMPMALQAKLLRVLEEGEIRPVGSNHEVSVDVRILAATNRDLLAEVEAGRFREDLYYRLETFILRIPPLRERGEDLDLLVARLLNQFCLQMNRDVRGVSESALERLRAYPFPGNVRELRNVMERAVAFCQGRTLEIRDLPSKIRDWRAPHASSASGDIQGPETLGDAIPVSTQDNGILLPLVDIENRYIAYVLKQVDGNKRRAAALLGIGRRTLYRRLEDMGVE